MENFTKLESTCCKTLKLAPERESLWQVVEASPKICSLGEFAE